MLSSDVILEVESRQVDMDMEDGDPVGQLPGSEERNLENLVIPHVGDPVSDGMLVTTWK